MRVYRSLFTYFVISALAFGYVHQRVEIIKAGYGREENRKQLSHLVDQNSKLMYNLSKLESSKNLLSSLDSGRIVFAGQRLQQRGSYVLSWRDHADEEYADGFISRVMDVFTEKAEAKSRR
ncbi:MAG: hypothetical protein KJ995_02140 [Candidatus Omnitrophica bacterium]|nr:hypothetical protein [Candidatus Omnitrophota bacterium]MBU1128817.1 hypothetical protein [Candidatus Omnitrophota bacterium]MBU1656657.1 hypothetical protein [Candidatus Omnitrophota bacterium]MBU1783790.1 hypothetical protein [Candidatus Omnitrophota bacterium]MBU1851190.1 hypothetical protein [Candidatus Omnitrophota bacterium]